MKKGIILSNSTAMKGYVCVFMFRFFFILILHCVVWNFRIEFCCTKFVFLCTRSYIGLNCWGVAVLEFTFVLYFYIWGCSVSKLGNNLGFLFMNLPCLCFNLYVYVSVFMYRILDFDFIKFCIM